MSKSICPELTAKDKVMSTEAVYDVIIIGGGQSALSVAYYLRRTELRYLILDNEDAPGGAWRHTWNSLTLFSPALWSSLPGIIMPGGSDYYPSRDQTIQYLTDYENRYNFPVARPVKVEQVIQQEGHFILSTNKGPYKAKAVISATGSYANPYIPEIPGSRLFTGQVMHSANYKRPDAFAGKRVAVVGEGNSGAQIMAEISRVADTTWITLRPPSFLPDEVDGRYLFDVATQIYKAKQEGRSYEPPSLGHIVKVPAVKEALQREIYDFKPAFDHFYEDGIAWNRGERIGLDAVIFCTGFRPALKHLESLGVLKDGRVHTIETRSTAIDGLWLVGYGSWTGFASATLIGVGRTAKRTVEEVLLYLKG